ncbi:MAG: PTS trehalose transporter subunit IIBC [Mycoplasmatales bacterium]
MNKDILKIIELVGGEKNVLSLSHCMTRLRFVLNDESLADVEGLEALSIVKGSFTQAGQFQIIIGNNVSEVYKEIIANTQIEEISLKEAKEVAKTKQSRLQRVMTFMSEIFAPIIPAIIVGGLILGFRNMIELPINGVALIDQAQFFKGLDSFLWLIGEAVFQFLPVYVCWSAYKKMGGTEILGMVLGVTLVSPQLINAYANSSGAEIPFWDFGFFTIEMIGYQGQVVPALLVGVIMGLAEVKINKYIPNAIKMIIAPMIIMIFGAFLAHAFIGPLGWLIGDYVAKGVMWLFTTLGFAGGMIFGFFYASLVITGLHHTTNAIDLQVIAESGSTPLWPLIALSNIAQGAAVLGILIMNKTAKSRELTVPSVISAWLGVTEPAMFGVNIKYGFPFFCAMIGSSVAGGFAILTGVTSDSIGVGGLPGIMAITPGKHLNFLIAMIIAICISLVLTIFMYKKKNLTSEGK